MLRLYTLTPLIFTFYLSIGQNSIIGKWKLVKATSIDYWNNKATKTFYKKNTKNSIKNSLNTKQNDVELILKTDSTFYAASFGIIIPNAEPGWIFGNKISGRWMFSNNKFLTLIIDNQKLSHLFYFRIDKLLTDSLIINETDNNFKNSFLILRFNQ